MWTIYMKEVVVVKKFEAGMGRDEEQGGVDRHWAKGQQ